MANLGKIVYLSEAQKDELFENGSVTSNGTTITYNENDIYVTPSSDIIDIRVNGTSIVSSGVANIPIATTTEAGLLKASGAGSGLQLDSSGYLKLSYPNTTTIKAGTNLYAPVVVGIQDSSVFYGLAQAAGDSTQAASSNAVGVYTDNAKIQIQKMLGIYEPPFVLLNDITLEERTSVSLTADDNNTPYNLRNVFMEIKYPADLVSESSGYGRWQFHNSNSDFLNCETGRYTTNSINCFKRLWTERKSNLILAYFSRQTNTGSYGGTYFKDTITGSRGAKFDFGNITAIKMNTNDYEPIGTQIKIWGQWAY